MRPTFLIEYSTLSILLYSELSQWIWARVLRQELDAFVRMRNGAPMRKNTSKAGPSGISRNTAYSLPGEWGGRECLLKVDVSIVRKIMEELGGDELLEFTPPEFRERAEAVFRDLGISKLTMENAWDVFTDMLPLLFPDN